MWLLKNKVGKSNQQKPGGLTVSDQLKDSRLNSDFILSAIEDGVVMVGRDNIVHLLNPAAARITGWDAKEAVGTNVQSIFSFVNKKGEPLPPTENPFLKALSTNAPVRDNAVTLTVRGGKSTVISLIVSPLLASDGQPSGQVIGVFRDVTREKEEEQQRSDFISTASHEMRTPLAAIEGYLSLAINPKISRPDENTKKYVEKAITATKHLSVLFQDLLNSSRAEDGRLASYPIVVEIGETVEQVVEAERFHAKEKNLILNYQVSSEAGINGGKVVRPLYYTFVDPHRVSEVLQNIIDNAIKYTMQGSITVRLTGDESVVQIQVTDTGTGIPADDIPHLFQKFYRVDNSTTRTVGGTGLGLFISKKIVELYNGRIWVESELGKGSTFYINLPRLTQAQALDAQQKAASISSPLETQG